MRSKAAVEVRQRQFDRYAVMTPDERVALAVRLGEEGLAAYLATHGVDRRTAVARRGALPERRFIAEVGRGERSEQGCRKGGRRGL